MELRPYQLEGIDWLRAHPRGLLADEPGLGKSVQLLMAAEGKTLIVAPAMVLDGGVWDDELARWRPDLDATTTSYSSLTARERTEKGGTRPTGKLRPELDHHWDSLILDESHYLKGRKTTWTQAALSVSADRVMLATGTPIPNWAHELFTTLQLLDPVEARPGGGLGSYWRWAKQWFDVTQMWGGYQVGGLIACRPACKLRLWPDVCEHWQSFHAENLEGRFLQRLRDDVLTDLPPLTQQWMRLPMGAAQAKLYRALKKDFIAWTESGDEIVAWNKAAQVTQLAKLCTGIEVIDPGSKGSVKLDALAQILKGRSRPCLVVAHFKASVSAALAVAVSAGLSAAKVDGDTSKGQRSQTIRSFQAGQLDVLVGSLEVVAEGLTLTQADTVVFLEHSWRPSRNEQAMRRIHRLGQTRPVTAIHLVTKDTIDDRIQKVLATKTDEAMKAMRPRDLAALV